MCDSDYIISKQLVERHLKKTFPVHLHAGFNDLLQKTHAIIAGSWSLYLVHQCQENYDLKHIEPQTAWQPTNMNIWVSCEYLDVVKIWIEMQNFSVTNTTSGRFVYLESIPAVRALYEVKSVGIQIIVLECTTQQVIQKVMDHFDLSIVKNYWDGKELGVRYMQHTREHKIVSQKNIQKHRLEKYKKRGYELFNLDLDSARHDSTFHVPMVDLNYVTELESRYKLKFPVSSLFTAVHFTKQEHLQLKDSIKQSETKTQSLHRALSHLDQITDTSHLIDLETLKQCYQSSLDQEAEKRNTDKSRLAMMEKLIHNNDPNSEETKPICTICYSRVVNTALSCGHVYCQVCSMRSNNCFICRCEITSSQHLFL